MAAKIKADKADSVAPPSALALDDVLNALLGEVVRGRLRNRALIEVLAKKGVIARSDYVEAYAIEEQRSFEAIADMLFLAPDDFRARHKAWLDSDRERYGYSALETPRIELQPISEAKHNVGTLAVDRPDTPASTKKRRKSKQD